MKIYKYPNTPESSLVTLPNPRQPLPLRQPLFLLLLPQTKPLHSRSSHKWNYILCTVLRLACFFFAQYNIFGASDKELACQCRRCKRCGFDPWVRKIPWTRKRQPTPVFLPGKSHGQRSLVGYSPWGCKESDTTKAT